MVQPPFLSVLSHRCAPGRQWHLGETSPSIAGAPLESRENVVGQWRFKVDLRDLMVIEQDVEKPLAHGC